MSGNSYITYFTYRVFVSSNRKQKHIVRYQIDELLSLNGDQHTSIMLGIAMSNVGVNFKNQAYNDFKRLLQKIQVVKMSVCKIITDQPPTKESLVEFLETQSPGGVYRYKVTVEEFQELVEKIEQMHENFSPNEP